MALYLVNYVVQLSLYHQGFGERPCIMVYFDTHMANEVSHYQEPSAWRT